jgi:hypothetical protein
MELIIGRQPIKGMGAGKRGVQLLKQPGLAHFARKIKADIIVGKDVKTMLAAHPVKGFFAALGKDHGLSLTNGGEVFLVWQAAGANDVPPGHNVWVKGQDHLSSRIS